MRALLLALALAAAPPAGGAASADAPAVRAAPDVTLRGVLTGADHQTYRELPFRVPPGVGRITVEVDYEGRDVRTTVDLGLRDPERFRGWSGGNKRRFSVGAEAATPSYLPGPLVPGEWRLVLGIPNIRRDSRSPYIARIWFERGPFAGHADAPLKSGPGWYAGDLHAHTGHSDGACPPRGGGARAPCPVFRTLEAAAAHGLDFIAVTDHNTTSQAASLQELQAYYAPLLVLPGREVTTFQGHANVVGPVAPLDFQVGGPRARGMNVVLRQAEAAGGLVIVNHPSSPSGEACMGCGWTVPDTDWTRVHAVEVVNGGSVRASAGSAEGPLSGIAFWEARLNEGRRLTAVGASDNHDASLAASEPSAVGRPRTVVWAEMLSQAAVLKGLKAGRAYVDVEGSGRARLEFAVSSGGRTALMGGELRAARGAAVQVTARVSGVEGRVELVDGGQVRAVDADGRATLVSDGGRRWLRANVRSAEGRLLLVGNPVYLNWSEPR